jgi:nucleoid-associated protein YgaU
MRIEQIVLLVAGLAMIGCQQSPPAPKTEYQSQPMSSPMAEAQQDQPRRLREVRPIEDPAVKKETPSRLSDSPAVTTAPPRTTPAKPAPPRGTVVHVIQKGDTFWNIAARKLGNGHRWKEIAALNPNVDPTQLSVGQKILLPEK